MTVSTTTNKVNYIGNGVATTFAIPFPFLEKEHLTVRQLLNDIQTERTDWTVSGGNMVFETAPADGAQILIMREVPLTQETDYRENEILPAETLERNFDKLTMQVQQLKEQSDRALLLDVFSEDDPNEFVKDFKNAVATAKNASVEAGNQAQAAAEQALIATAAAARTDWVDVDSEQTIKGVKTIENNHPIQRFRSTVARNGIENGNCGALIASDKNDITIGRLEAYVQEGTFNNITAMRVYSPTDGSLAGSVYLQAQPDGKILFAFPKCTTQATTASSASANSVAVVVQNYRNGLNWYRVWSDGWIEQGGVGGTSPTVNFLKSFNTTDYTFLSIGRTTGTAYPMCEVVANRTKTYAYLSSTATTTYTWYACGY